MEPAMPAIAATPDATGAGTASGAEQERGHRFEQLLQNEPLRENFYVDAQASSSTANPLAAVVSEFNAMDLLPDAVQAERGRPDPGASLFEQFQTANDHMILLQAELLRMTLMVETVSTAKQGVTTMFQQQG